MESNSIKISNLSTINTKLKSDLVINEAVMVAYGSAKKSNITGSITSISGDKLANRPVSSPLTALAGLAPGVQINNSSGQPGSSPSIRIRGIGSYNASSEPLIVLDGSPFDGSLSSINNSDIENISILKDAASTALYGSRGANGVILITTKRGIEGPLKLDIHISQGISQRGQSNYEKVDAFEYLPLMWESLRNGYMSNKQSLEQASANASSGGNLGIIYKLGYNPFKGIPNSEVISIDGKLNFLKILPLLQM